jgi:putative ABC transport system ATP-binding protein
MKLRLRDVDVVYDKGTPLEAVALRNFSLEIENGSPTVIWGANGSGKTSLLRVLAGEIKPASGLIELNRVGNWERASYRWLTSEVEYVRQQPYAGLFLDLTLRENLALRLRGQDCGWLDPYRASSGFREKEQELQLHWPLYRSKQNHNLVTLSGGEQQLFALLVASVAGRHVFLFDEPSSALDEKRSGDMLVMLRELLLRPNVASVVVTHDRSFADALGFRVIKMDQNG